MLGGSIAAGPGAGAAVGGEATMVGDAGLAATGAEGRGWIGTNSPGRHVCGWRRIVGSFRNRSAWPQLRQMRVPSDSSPPGRIDKLPRPIVPVFRLLTQTNSPAPQFEHTGDTEAT
jgi:hypothetical protein